MTTAINTDNPTLLDLTKRMDPNGAIAPIVELLQKRNAILEDATFQEGNLVTGHRFTSRTALPGLTWRRFNEGVTPTKGRTDQVDETCGMLEGNSVVDCALAKLNDNEAAYRASEDKGFIAAMSNEVETGFVYHSTLTAPEKFMGLSPRLNSSTGPAGKQIIMEDATASGSDQTSIWLVCWSPESVFGIVPKGSVAGLTPKDMGEQMWDDGSGKRFRAYVTNWSWQLGLCVKDYRQVVRIGNVDTGNLAATGSAIIVAMIKAYHQLFDPRMGRCAFYCNRTVGTYLHLQALDSTKNATLSIDRVAGMPITTCLGVPVRTTDAILNTEATLV